MCPRVARSIGANRRASSSGASTCSVCISRSDLTDPSLSPPGVNVLALFTSRLSCPANSSSTSAMCSPLASGSVRSALIGHAPHSACRLSASSSEA